MKLKSITIAAAIVILAWNSVGMSQESTDGAIADGAVIADRAVGTLGNFGSDGAIAADGAVADGTTITTADGTVVAGGDATRCGLPAPQYPVPFATPRPTVPTNFTYPPMMPHNSLPHYRNVYSYRHADGLSRTNVRWHSQPIISGLRRAHAFFEIPR